MPGRCARLFFTWKSKDMNSDFERSGWTVLALANCTTCNGSGLVKGEQCGCVYRGIARRVLWRVAELEISVGLIHPVSMDPTQVPRSQRIPSLRIVEFIADVDNVARRILTDPVDLRIYRHHFRERHQWRWCCQQCHISRASFFYRSYIVLAKLGETFLCLKPYPLFPTDQYFETKLQRVQPFPAFQTPRRYVPLRPPLAGLTAPQPVTMVQEPAARKTGHPPLLYPTPVPLDTAPLEVVLETIRRWYSAGRSPRGISCELTRLGCLCPYAAKWSRYTVYTALRSAPLQKRAA